MSPDMTPGDSEVRRQVALAEQLLTGLDDLPQSARAQALDAVHALVTLYGACLARVMRHADGDTARTLAADELVGHLLLVHDLHPDPPATRIRRALARLGEGGGERLTLDGLDGATARVRVRSGGCGGGSGCGSPAKAVQAAVEAAVTTAAPEVERVELVTDDAGTARRPALIPVAALTRRPALEGRPR